MYSKLLGQFQGNIYLDKMYTLNALCIRLCSFLNLNLDPALQSAPYDLHVFLLLLKCILKQLIIFLIKAPSVKRIISCSVHWLGEWRIIFSSVWGVWCSDAQWTPKTVLLVQAITNETGAKNGLLCLPEEQHCCQTHTHMFLADAYSQTCICVHMQQCRTTCAQSVALYPHRTMVFNN